MCRRSFATDVLIRAVLSVTVAHSLVSPGHAQSTTGEVAVAEAFPGVLLLKNGGTIEGELSHSGDRWTVRNAGRELDIPASNVDLAGRSLAELFDAQRKRIARPTADAHLSLADWCIRHELFDQASQQLADARRLEPRHPRLALFEHRLAVAIEQRARPPVATISETSDASAPVPPAAEPVPEVASQSPPSAEVIEMFTRRVQPILVNNCTTAGCHQPGGPQSFQLDRALLHGMSNRRTTTSNLAATLALVDWTRPHLSPLLTVPRSPHGGLEEPVFGPQQAQLVEQLARWVARVVEAPSADEPAVTVKTTNASQRVDAHVRPAAGEEPIAAEPTARGPQYGAQRQVWKPKDPFDPAIFNRHYRTPVNGGGSSH